jgi:chemotaxis protein methyltransferase CheR
MQLTDEQFDRARRLALRLTGIELLDRHQELLGRRSRGLGIPDGTSLDALLVAVELGDATATRQLVRLLTTRFTGFFRHPRHFELASQHALHAVDRRGRARLWSAGAATGEEPYSLAMVLLEVLPHEVPPAGILATDIDAEALAIARRAEYREAALSPLSPGRRKRFLTEAVDGQRWGLAPEARRLVEFRELNLAGRDGWPAGESFDVIFCRNVLMYLEAGHRDAALERFAALLTPEGILILDPSEHLGRAGHLFASCVEGVCAPRREGHAWATEAGRRLSRQEF